MKLDEKLRPPDEHWLRRWRGEIIASLLALILAIVSFFTTLLWFLAASASVAAASLVAIAFNMLSVPHSYRKLRKQMNHAATLSTKHPILGRRHEDMIASISRELDELASGRFSFDVWQVPQLSVFAMQIVDSRCVLMFPLRNSEALLTPQSGPAADYYDAMVSASSRMRMDGRHGVIRVFLLTQTDEISELLMNFMERNETDGIDSRMLFLEELPPRPAGVDELDFGYYRTAKDEEWVMLLRTIDGAGDSSVVHYEIETNSTVIASYRAYAEEIVLRAKSVDELRALVSQPMNGSLWPAYLAERGFDLPPPHGLSHEDADYVVKSVQRAIRRRNKATILVLGLTPRILRRLQELDLYSLDSLDQFPSKPAEFEGMVNFYTGNWLDSEFSGLYDCIVFDESLNNLTQLQLQLFLPELKKLLKPGGHAIGRVLGRFDEDITGQYTNMTEWQVLDHLRALDGRTHDEYAPLIVCMLHSCSIAFSDEDSLVDCGAWNDWLLRMRASGQITSNELNRWRLPFSFRLLSPDLDTLIRMAMNSGLSPVEIRPVKGSYVDRWKDVGYFYRIVNFESTKSSAPTQAAALSSSRRVT